MTDICKQLSEFKYLTVLKHIFSLLQQLNNTEKNVSIIGNNKNYNNS